MLALGKMAAECYTPVSRKGRPSHIHLSLSLTSDSVQPRCAWPRLVKPTVIMHERGSTQGESTAPLLMTLIFFMEFNMI